MFKKIASMVICMALIFTIFGNVKSASASTLDEIKARGSFIVATDPGYFPFEMIDEKGKIIGFDIDIAQELAKAMKVKLEILPVQWDGIIPALQTKKVDAIIAGMSITKERAKVISFSIPYFKTGLGLLVNEKHKGMTTWKDLDVKGNKIGVMLGMASDLYAEKFFKNAEVMKFTNDSATMATAVASGRLDAAMHDEPWVIIYAKKNPQGLFAFVSEKHEEQPLGVALIKDDKDMKRLVDKTIASFLNSPKYKELYNYWFVTMPWMKK